MNCNSEGNSAKQMKWAILVTMETTSMIVNSETTNLYVHEKPHQFESTFLSKNFNLLPQQFYQTWLAIVPIYVVVYYRFANPLKFYSSELSSAQISKV